MYGQTDRSSYAMPRSLKIEEEGNRHIFRLLADELVQDVTKDSRYQKQGIDLIISRGSRNLTVDTKNDTYVSGNCFAETMSSIEKCVLGCFLTSKADYWFYYLLNRGEVFALPMEATREYVLRNLTRFPKSRPIPNKGYHSEGHMVPWKALLQNVPDIAHINIAAELGFQPHAPSILPADFAHKTRKMKEFLDTCTTFADSLELAA
jgi:hypothetical protein